MNTPRFILLLNRLIDKLAGVIYASCLLSFMALAAFCLTHIR